MQCSFPMRLTRGRSLAAFLRKSYYKKSWTEKYRTFRPTLCDKNRLASLLPYFTTCDCNRLAVHQANYRKNNAHEEEKSKCHSKADSGVNKIVTRFFINMELWVFRIGHEHSSLHLPVKYFINHSIPNSSKDCKDRL